MDWKKGVIAAGQYKTRHSHLIREAQQQRAYPAIKVEGPALKPRESWPRIGDTSSAGYDRTATIAMWRFSASAHPQDQQGFAELILQQIPPSIQQKTLNIFSC